MKKQFLTVLAVFSIALIPAMYAGDIPAQTFQDKPALTLSEEVVMEFLPAYGTASAILGTGVLMYKYALKEKIKKEMGRRGTIGTQSERIRDINVSKQIIAVIKPFGKVEFIEMLKRGVPIWAVEGGFVYKISKMLAVYKLSRSHGVSYRVENISQYYNINIGQYRKILTAAESREREVVIKAINELYPKRFGMDWKTRMQTLFAKYAAQASSLVKRGSFDKNLTADERDFVRMIELGAAMANLYYKTQPSRKNAVDSAMKLYRELGILT